MQGAEPLLVPDPLIHQTRDYEDEFVAKIARPGEPVHLSPERDLDLESFRNRIRTGLPQLPPLTAADRRSGQFQI
ncbi:hypothetical protein [Arthrobacter woluwensis]|uniref:hypothetical protein n=1 Tax=Arthrobacter woluwensis TaxID=156980 RepID=UPI001AAE7F11|nr:hypothetical protein [Arthrobacter woluwensis]